MFRRLGEQLVIFVEKWLRRAWFGRLMRCRTSIVYSRRRGNDERNGQAQECQVCADEDEEEGRERLQGIVVAFAFAFAVWTSPSNALVHPATWRPSYAPLVLVLHAYRKTHDPVVCLWVAPRPLFLYIFSGWVIKRVECLATVNNDVGELVRVATCLFGSVRVHLTQMAASSVRWCDQVQVVQSAAGCGRKSLSVGGGKPSSKKTKSLDSTITCLFGSRTR